MSPKTAAPLPDAGDPAALLELCLPGCPLRLPTEGDQRDNYRPAEQSPLAALHQQMLADAGIHWQDWNALPADWLASASAQQYSEQLRLQLARASQPNQAEQTEQGKRPLVCRDSLTARLLPLWQRALQQDNRHAIYLLPLCSPQQLSATLAATMPDWQARLLWLRHMLEAESASRGQPRLLLCIDDAGKPVNDDWRAALDRLAGNATISAALLAGGAPTEPIQSGYPASLTSDSDATAQLTITQWSEHAWQALQELAGNELSGHLQGNVPCDAQGDVQGKAQDDTQVSTDAQQAIQKLDTVRTAFDAACSLMGGLLFEQQRAQQTLSEDLRNSDTRQRQLANELDQAETRNDRLSNRAEHHSSSDTQAQLDAALLQLNALQNSAAWLSAKPLHWLEQRKPGLVKRAAQLPRLTLWALTGQLTSKRQMQADLAEIQRSGLFDASWYIRHNPDVVIGGHDALLHWASSGWREGRDPHPLLRTSAYLQQHPELLQNGINPLLDYLRAGADGTRQCGTLFDSPWYASQHPQVRESGLAPLSHYLLHGAAAGLDPSPLFSHTWYLQQSADVAASGSNPLMHFIAFGAAAGRDPCPFFSTVWYLQRYPDVAAAGINPLQHFIEFGADEGRDPGPQFDTRWFQHQHAELTQTAQPRRNPLAFYLHHPDREQLAPTANATLPVTPLIDSASATLDDSAALSQLLPDWQADADDPWQGLGVTRSQPGNSVMVVDEKHPTPDLDSGSYRMRKMLECLVKAGLDVVFVGDQQATDPRYVRELQQQGITALTGRKAALRHLMSRGDALRAVILSRPASAQRYLPLVRAYASAATVIYDTVDLHWVRLQRGARVADDPTTLLAAADHYQRLEMANARAADLTIAITDEERDTLRAADPSLQLTVVPNIHDIVTDVAPFSQRQNLFFIGSYAHPPNVEAMHWLVSEVLPLVVEQLPGIRLRMVGSEMPDEIAALASEHVDAVGYAEDVSDYFQQSRVFVAPLLHGAGMKGKVGQSLSYGLPVVTTAIGAEGIGLQDGVSAMISDDAAGLAQRIVTVYQDEALWQRLSREGQAVIASRFSPAVVERQILDMLGNTEPGA